MYRAVEMSKFIILPCNQFLNFQAVRCIFQDVLHILSCSTLIPREEKSNGIVFPRWIISEHRKKIACLYASQYQPSHIQYLKY